MSDAFTVEIRPGAFSLRAAITTRDDANRFARAFNAAVDACFGEDDEPAAAAADEPRDSDAESAAKAAAQDPPPAVAAPKSSGPPAAGAAAMKAVRPGSLDERVLACLRRGVVGVGPIADELDMTLGPVGAAIRRLLDGGFWPPKPAGAEA